MMLHHALWTVLAGMFASFLLYMEISRRLYNADRATAARISDAKFRREYREGKYRAQLMRDEHEMHYRGRLATCLMPGMRERKSVLLRPRAERMY